MVSDQILKLGQSYGYSDNVVEHLADVYPDSVEQLIRAFQRPAPQIIRTNTLKITPEDLKERLMKKGCSLRETKWVDYGFWVVESPTSMGATHEYLKGYYSLQSLSSMIPVHLLAPHKDETVLDMCAAPGSKTTQIAMLMENQGQLVAVDNDENRIVALTSNLERSGVKNTIVLQEDAKTLKDKKLVFDKILLDAPCSGIGRVWKSPIPRKHPDRAYLKPLMEEQVKLLQAGLRCLKKGGILVYSTCSLYPEENEEIIQYVLSKKQNVELLDPWDSGIGIYGRPEYKGKKYPSEIMLKTRRITPHEHDSEGFFIAMFQRKND